MYTFRGVLFGFDGPQTTDHDAPRLRNHLEAFAADSVQLFGSFRTGSGERLRGLEQMGLRYFDPGNSDPELQDCAVTFKRRGGACGALSIYQVAWYRFCGERATFVLSMTEQLGIKDGRRVVFQLWHVRLRRANGEIECWSRRLGMKG